MIDDARTADVCPGTREERRGAVDAPQRDATSFLSTRLLRELLQADARCEAGSQASRAEALLAAVLGDLDLLAGAIVQVEPSGEGPRCAAARGVPDHARELFERRVPLEELGGSLLQRALTERRVLLLDRSTRDPLMPALRDGNPEIECAALVPLVDLSVPVGVLLLAARGGRLSPPLLRSLAAAFRLLAVLLSPSRGRVPAAPRPEDAAPPNAETERYLFEIEELTARLAEAREAARRMEERATSADAALRAEVETWRARVAELEAQLAGQEPAGDRLGELEETCAAQLRALEERDERIAQLEEELRGLHERLGVVEREARSSSRGTDADWPAEDAASLAEADDEAEDEEAPTQSLDLSDAGDVQLGDIAAEVAAAMEDGTNGNGALAGEEEAGELDLGDLVDDESEPREETGPNGADDPEIAIAIMHLDSAREAQQLTSDTVAAAGAAYWCGVGAAPPASRQVIAANLFDPTLVDKVAALSIRPSAQRWIVYACDVASGLGFELPSCALLRRPIDPAVCLEQIRQAVKHKLGGIVLVSAQLRELAPLRQALHECDAAGSVACDVRQALDLLEIVRRPDAVVLDLALPQGQALTLAAQLRRQPETSDLPLLLLLPSQIDAERMRMDAERAQLLGPFAAEDVRRVVRAALAGRY